jgi:hypothetical protein
MCLLNLFRTVLDAWHAPVPQEVELPVAEKGLICGMHVTNVVEFSCKGAPYFHMRIDGVAFAMHATDALRQWMTESGLEVTKAVWHRCVEGYFETHTPKPREGACANLTQQKA